MKPPMRVEPFKGILFFICAIVFCMVVTLLITAFVTAGGLSPARLRIATIVQDVVLFVIPAIMTAVIVTRYPARFLAVDNLPPLKITILAIITLFASIPAVDYLVTWNESISLPTSMAGLEEWMKQSETNAEATVKLLMNGTSVGSLVLSLLIVAVLAGFSEEIFFRGTLQRLLTPANKKVPHLAIWVTAFIFSAIHLQFYGFVPRLLLGAFFGYLLVWSGSLWVPVIAHILNNSVVVVSTWLIDAGYMVNRIDRLGAESTTWDVALGSAVLVAGLIVIIRRESLQLNKKTDNKDNENDI